MVDLYKYTSDELDKLICLLKKANLGLCALVPVSNPDFILSTFSDFEKLSMLSDDQIKGKIIQFSGEVAEFMNDIYFEANYKNKTN